MLLKFGYKAVHLIGALEVLCRGLELAIDLTPDGIVYLDDETTVILPCIEGSLMD